MRDEGKIYVNLERQPASTSRRASSPVIATESIIMNTDNQQKKRRPTEHPPPPTYMACGLNGFVAAVAAGLGAGVCSGGHCGGLFAARATHLTVCKYADEYLPADIEAAKVELSFWSTFPKLNTVQSIDTLAIDSHMH